MATQTKYDVVATDEDVDSDATIDYHHGESESSGSYTDIYEDDPAYDGPVYQSQPCMSGIHGASYTPPGWRRRTVKRKRLLENTVNDEKEIKSDSD